MDQGHEMPTAVLYKVKNEPCDVRIGEVVLPGTMIGADSAGGAPLYASYASIVDAIKPCSDGGALLVWLSPVSLDQSRRDSGLHRCRRLIVQAWRLTGGPPRSGARLPSHQPPENLSPMSHRAIGLIVVICSTLSGTTGSAWVEEASEPAGAAETTAPPTQRRDSEGRRGTRCLDTGMSGFL